MKRKTARDIPAESFRELAAGKNVEKITVKEITGNCGYSPATFYRQFRDKYDLIAWDYSQSVSQIMSRLYEENLPWSRSLKDGAEYFYEQRDYLKNLFVHTSGIDSFIYNMIEINFRHLRAHVLRAAGEKELDEITEMCIRHYCMGTVSLTCEWVMGKYALNADELAEVFEKSVPVSLQKYLY